MAGYPTDQGARFGGAIPTYSAGNTYETVAASVTAQVLGTTGAVGDVIDSILVIPLTTTPGLVTLTDGSTAIPLFLGGTTTLQPFAIPLGLKSVNGAWKISTGANVSVIASGFFT